MSRVERPDVAVEVNPPIDSPRVERIATVETVLLDLGAIGQEGRLEVMKRWPLRVYVTTKECDGVEPHKTTEELVDEVFNDSIGFWRVT